MNEIFSTCGICHGKIGLKPCNCFLQNNKHDLGIAEAIGFDKGYKAATAKTLTDEEINEIFSKTWLDLKDYKDFARAILKKASEK
jgi:uncharacterized membrane protein